MYHKGNSLTIEHQRLKDEIAVLKDQNQKLKKRLDKMEDAMHEVYVSKKKYKNRYKEVKQKLEILQEVYNMRKTQEGKLVISKEGYFQRNEQNFNLIKNSSKYSKNEREQADDDIDVIMYNRKKKISRQERQNNSSIQVLKKHKSRSKEGKNDITSGTLQLKQDLTSNTLHTMPSTYKSPQRTKRISPEEVANNSSSHLQNVQFRSLHQNRQEESIASNPQLQSNKRAGKIFRFKNQESKEVDREDKYDLKFDQTQQEEQQIGKFDQKEKYDSSGSQDEYDSGNNHKNNLKNDYASDQYPRRSDRQENMRTSKDMQKMRPRDVRNYQQNRQNIRSSNNRQNRQDIRPIDHKQNIRSSNMRSTNNRLNTQTIRSSNQRQNMRLSDDRQNIRLSGNAQNMRLSDDRQNMRSSNHKQQMRTVASRQKVIKSHNRLSSNHDSQSYTNNRLSKNTQNYEGSTKVLKRYHGSPLYYEKTQYMIENEIDRTGSNNDFCFRGNSSNKNYLPELIERLVLELQEFSKVANDDYEPKRNEPSRVLHSQEQISNKLQQVINQLHCLSKSQQEIKNKIVESWSNHIKKDKKHNTTSKHISSQDKQPQTTKIPNSQSRQKLNLSFLKIIQDIGKDLTQWKIDYLQEGFKKK